MRSMLAFTFLFLNLRIEAQVFKHFVDSVRVQYNIPALGFAVVSSNEIKEMEVLGFKRINSSEKATINSRFRIGSNTKSVTGMIAALLVKQQKIKWNTKFFDVYPELKGSSNPKYHQLTLLNLLSFRTQLIKYTYTDSLPLKEQIIGTESAQRYEFAKWFLSQKEVKSKNTISFSNLGYVAASLMLERVSNKMYRQLLAELNDLIGIQFEFGAPNWTDSTQTWGHNSKLEPELPTNSYKLNWLEAAGNLNISLPDYVNYIQLQLQGLKGNSDLLDKTTFEFLHFGLPKFAVGWFWDTQHNGNKYSYNIGNPGTFYSKVIVFKDANLGIIALTNSQTKDTEKGVDVIFEALEKHSWK